MADVHIQDAGGVAWFGGGQGTVLAEVSRNGSEEE